jgi:hypothetical protein
MPDKLPEIFSNSIEHPSVTVVMFMEFWIYSNLWSWYFLHTICNTRVLKVLPHKYLFIKTFRLLLCMYWWWSWPLATHVRGMGWLVAECHSHLSLDHAVHLLSLSKMSEQKPWKSRFLKFVLLYTLLVVMCKEWGFSTGVVNFRKSASQPVMWETQSFVLQNFITWTRCQEHTSFVMQGCTIICKFTEGLREINCFVIME